jgi:hypothetical protein
MRSYGKYQPRRNSMYLSQVMLVPYEAFAAATAALQALLQPQINSYGCLVRFFTPQETLLIAGIRPQSGPETLVWELAGNACSPLLLFEALSLVMPPDFQCGLTVQDLREAWLRKLGVAPMCSVSPGPFPGPIDTSILIKSANVFFFCRMQSSASILELYAAASQLLGLEIDDFCFQTKQGWPMSADSPQCCGTLYGKALFCQLAQP